MVLDARKHFIFASWRYETTVEDEQSGHCYTVHPPWPLPSFGQANEWDVDKQTQTNLHTVHLFVAMDFY